MSDSYADQNEQAVKNRRDRFLGPGSALFYEQPVHIVRGEGVLLFDAAGHRYVDMYNNVPSIGHCHPHLVDAVSQQIATLNVHSRYLHAGIVDYAERLTGKLHSGIEAAVFTCTGTEANEVALMMARAATGGLGIVCTDAAYHGNSTEVRKLNHNKASDGEFRSIPFPQTYRLPVSADPLDYYLSKLQAVIESFARDQIAFAGMLVCPLLANEGLPNLPHGFMAGAVDIVHSAGGLFIADEVQAGLCRSGNWWGYEAMGCVPDIVSMGKPLGAGVPVAGVAASTALVENFRSHSRYFNTFASTPLQAAAGNAVLDVIEQQGLCEQVASVGALLLRELKRSSEPHQHIGEVRGCGLFIGLEWVTDRSSKKPDRGGAVRVVNALKNKGYLISNAGAYGNILKLRPPLVFDHEDAEDFLGVFEETLADLGG
jgi:4-aminobutyrate aminotransferase-like enzyme